MTNDEILNELSELMPNNPGLSEMQEAITQIMEFDEDTLTPSMIEMLIQTIKVMFDSSVTTEMTNNLKRSFHDQGLTRADVTNYLGHFEGRVQNFINKLEPSINKRKLLHAIFEPMIITFDKISEEYHNYDITLPMTLDEGAKLPTYAHDTDACADIYASQNIILPAHSQSNMVHTGIHMALPESWVFMIDPRSSIGYKTGLRLSNSVGIIDEDYRGEIGILYDNISDSDYEIKAGDRIAQGWVQPVYRFKPIKVDILPATERGSGGFGSTGK